jgi:hypothetical protein
MEILENMDKKVMYFIKGPLQMDTPLQFMVVFNGFSNKKHPKMIGIKKTTMSIWTSHFDHVQHDWAIKLDLVILTSKMTNKMTNYLIGK